MSTENIAYQLKMLDENEYNNYMKAYQANSIIPRGFFTSEVATSVIWNEATEPNRQTYCIYEKVSNTFCGYCDIRFIDTPTPEVGINLLPDYQGKGVGKIALSLMMNNFAETHPLDYFIAKVDSNNGNCLSLMQKMGGTLMRSEENKDKQILKSMSEIATSYGLSYSDENSSELEYKVLVFRLNPI